MTNEQLINQVAKATGLPKKTAAQALEIAFDQIARAIRKEKRFWVPGFGTFTVRKRRARAGFNPRTKTAMTIAAARTVGFRPAHELKTGL
jgi:DNA-binding protein HU-beta